MSETRDAADGSEKDLRELLLMGRFYWNQRTREAFAKSAQSFQRAIEKAPRSAEAWVGLGETYILLGYYSLEEPLTVFPQAVRATEKALEIDPASAGAWAVKGHVLFFFQRDVEASVRCFEKTLSLDPSYPTCAQWYSEILVLSGKVEEGNEIARKALHHDPHSSLINTLQGWVRYYSNDPSSAIPFLKQQFLQNFPPALYWLALSYREVGELDKAIATLERIPQEEFPVSLLSSCLASILSRQGSREKPLQLLESLQELEEYVSNYQLAIVRAAVGDLDGAFGELSRALEKKDPWILNLACDPVWSSLSVAGDKRFAKLCGQLPGGEIL